MTFTFQKAARHAVKLKIGIDGPSGAGKSLGALAIAHGITNGGRIAVADSENGSASLYADRFAFDTVTVPDAEPDTYKAIIDAAVAQGYDVLVIDSLSHAWLKVLAEKEEYDRRNPKSNSWTNWRVFGPKWDGLMQHILQAPIHIIATMRSKQAYEQVESGGRKQVVKLGLQPQVRDGAEYEFGLVFSVNIAHAAEASKDRTGLFTDRLVDLCDPKLHAELVRWMNAGGPGPASLPPLTQPEGEQRRPPSSGANGATSTPSARATSTPATPTPAATTNSADASGRTVEWAKAYPLPFKKSPSHGKPLGEFSLDGLETLREWIVGKQAEGNPTFHEETLAAVQLLIADAESQQASLFEAAAEASDTGDEAGPALGAGSGGTAVAEAPAQVAAPAEPESVVALTKRLNALLTHEKISDERRAYLRRQLVNQELGSTAALQKAIAQLENEINLPF